MGQRYEKNKKNVSENKNTIERLKTEKDTLRNEYSPLSLLDSIQGILEDEAADAVQDVRTVGELESQRIESETDSANEERKQITNEIDEEIAKLNAGLEKLRKTGNIEFGKNAIQQSSQEYKKQIEKFKALKAELINASSEGNSSAVDHIIQNNSEIIDSLQNETLDESDISEQSAPRVLDNKTSYSSQNKQTEHRPLVTSREEAINTIVEDVRIGSGRTVTAEQAEKYYESVQVFSGQDMTGGNDDYRGIRGAYNNPLASSEEKERLRNLDEYINSAPKWEGTVYRGINVDQKTAGSILANSEVDMLGPASWSSDFDTAERFSRGSKPVRMVFLLPENKSGASITHIASYDGMESEVTSPSGIKYAIDNHQRVFKDGREYLYVYLRE